MMQNKHGGILSYRLVLSDMLKKHVVVNWVTICVVVSSLHVHLS